MSSPDYDKVQVDDVEEDEEDDDSIEDYERGAVLLPGRRSEERPRRRRQATLMRELLDQYEDMKKMALSCLPEKRLESLVVLLVAH
jgi:hypothetical protein